MANDISLKNIFTRFPETYILNKYAHDVYKIYVVIFDVE